MKYFPVQTDMRSINCKRSWWKVCGEQLQKWWLPRVSANCGRSIILLGSVSLCLRGTVAEVVVAAGLRKLWSEYNTAGLSLTLSSYEY
ncbi:hypothetical protein J6590_018966 [Homalodisca vitripennis]|nr:hypothetical protein J6590_018966 [Homalodisca vitripennis]